MLNIYKTGKAKKFLDSEWHNPNYRNSQLHPKHMLVCGGSGTGKTNFLLNLLMQFPDTFHKVTIVTTLAHEALYDLLQDQLKDRCEIITLRDLPPPSQLDSTTPKLVVFDDFVHVSTAQAKIIEEYAILSRKKMCMCVFLAQSFYAVSKIVRQQVRYIVLLNMTDARNLNAIASSLGCELTPSVLKAVIRNATAHALNVCLIDVHERDLNNKKLRRNFSDFYTFVEQGNEMRPAQMYEGSGILN